MSAREWPSTGPAGALWHASARAPAARRGAGQTRDDAITGWLAATAVVGKWMLIASGGVLLLTMLALAIYALRKGERSDAPVNPSMQPFGPHPALRQTGFVSYRRRAKLTVLTQRKRFSTMQSLVDGSATRQDWAVVIGIQVAFFSFWLVFLGGSLMKLEDTYGLSLFLPAAVGLWLFGIVSAQRIDLVAARKRLARSGRNQE